MIQNIASLAKNEKGEKVIKIVFTENHFDLTLSHVIRNLPGRKYYPDLKCWSCPPFDANIEILKKWNFVFDLSLQQFLDKRQKRLIEISYGKIENLKGQLFPFQNTGVAFIEDKKGRVLIADEQGTGKTIQSLAWLAMHPEKRPCVVVVPASVKLNWQKEAKLWLQNPRCQILSGTKTYKITGEIIIINYDILYAWVESLKEINPQVLICDESQYFKSNTRRTKAVKKLGKNIPHIICLSGTPILNKPIEIFNALKLIDENLFPHFANFVKRYCNPKYNGYGWDYTGSSNESELNQLLTSTVMLRRLKKDVLKDLPDKIYSYVPIELDNKREYQSAENDFIAYVRRTKGQEQADRISEVENLAKIEGLKQLAVKGKLKQVVDWIKDFLESGEKLVVFATHKFVIESLMTEFKDVAVKIDGSVSTTQRQKAVDDFQNKPEIKLFVGNLIAAGTGITLTAASNLAFIELGWSPKTHDQASDRVHRISQKFAVNIYYLLAEGTIEEKIAKLLDKKRKTVDAVIDGKQTEQESLLHELMKLYSK